MISLLKYHYYCKHVKYAAEIGGNLENSLCASANSITRF